MRSATNNGLRRSGLSAVVLAFGVWLDATAALAACAPVAANGVTVVCSGNTVNQNDPDGFGTGVEDNVTIEVLSGASVTGTDDGIDLRDNATIDNAGAVSGGDFGIIALDDLSVTNSGLISGVVDGINASDNVSVTNSGSISGASRGVDVINDGRVINSGSISGGAVGVQGSNNLSLVNRGSISGGQLGIDGGGVVGVANSGSISGGAGGITTGTLTLSNSGTVSGSNFGVSVISLTSLTNAGRIVGGAGGAIREGGGADTTLTLLPGSVIVGTIELGGGVNTLNFGGGLNLATTFETAAPVIGDSGGVPFLVNGTQVIVVDPTGFAAAEIWLETFATSILNAIEANAGAAGSGGVGGSPAAPASLAAADPDGPGQGVWGSFIGGLRDQDAEGSVAGLELTYGGALLGADALHWEGLTLGGFLGGALSRQEVEGDAQEIDATSALGGLYLRQDWGGAWAGLTLAGGWVGHESERRVANNLAPGGIERARADYDGYFVLPAATLGTRLGELLPGLGLEPSLRLHYAGLFLEDYAEEGSAAPLRVESRDLHQAGGRMQLALPYRFEAAEGGRVRIEARFGLDGRLDLGGDGVEARVAGAPLDFAASYDDESATGFLGFGAAWTSADGRTVFGGATELRAGSDGTRGLDGQLRAELRFAY